MDEYNKELLRKNLEVSEESLKILKKMNRARVVGGVLRVFKWIIIIGISLGSYYYIEPYLKGLLNVYNNINAGAGHAGASNIVPGFIEKLKNLLPE